MFVLGWDDELLSAFLATSILSIFAFLDEAQATETANKTNAEGLISTSAAESEEAEYYCDYLL